MSSNTAIRKKDKQEKELSGHEESGHFLFALKHLHREGSLSVIA